MWNVSVHSHASAPGVLLFIVSFHTFSYKYNAHTERCHCQHTDCNSCNHRKTFFHFFLIDVDIALRNFFLIQIGQILIILRNFLILNIGSSDRKSVV